MSEGGAPEAWCVIENLWRSLYCRKGLSLIHDPMGPDAASLLGNTYFWSSFYTTAGNNDHILYVRNDSSDSFLRINYASLTSSKTTNYSIHYATGTPGGTLVTGVNSNRSILNIAEATAYGDADVTGLTPGGVIRATTTASVTSVNIDLGNNIVLGDGDSIAIQVLDTNGNSDVGITLIGHYADE
mgnify:CR=1 FL=1